VREPTLVDTDVVSYLLKGDSRGDFFAAALTDRLPVISFVTVAALYLWAESHNWGPARRERMHGYLNTFVV
jgi:predicted nucleic acid-binding protein